MKRRRRLVGGVAHTDIGALHSTLDRGGEAAHASGQSAVPQAAPTPHNEVLDSLPPFVRAVLATPGRSLEFDTRTFFESRFGHDFTAVRLHDDALARASVHRLNVPAYAIANHIVFDPRHYNTRTSEGLALIAHELGHVAQGPSSPSSALVTTPGDPTERAADAAAEAVLVGRRPAITRCAAPPVLRKAPESWWRGEGEGVGPMRSGGAIHDFGDGLYLTDDPAVAQRYAELRAEGRTTGRVLVARFERSLLGRVLDLASDPRFSEYMRTPPYPGAPTPETIIRQANENYYRFFVNFLRRHQINLESYDAVIGPEYVRGGNQICVRSPSIAQRVRALLRPYVPASGGSGQPPESGRPRGSEGQARPQAETVRAGARGGPSAEGAPSEPQFRVQSNFRVTNTSRAPNGNLLSEVEVVFARGLDEVNRAATQAGGRPLPSRMLIRVTQTIDGVFVAAEPLAGESPALAELVGRQAVATVPRAAGASGGGAAAGAATVSPWVRGFAWAGLLVFAGITTYQLYTAPAEERPRVAASAGGGFVGATISSYLICNLIFGIETVGWSLLGCALVAGIPGGVVGSEAGGAIYDAMLTPVERALRDLSRQPPNVRRLFHAMVAGTRTGIMINEQFIRGFIATVPQDLRDDELALLTGQLGSLSLGASLQSVLWQLEHAIRSLPGRGPRILPPMILPPMLDITDVRGLGRGAVRMDALGSGRIRILPGVRPPPRGLDYGNAPVFAPWIEVDL